MKKSVEIKHQRWVDAGYSRRKCLEIAGISGSMPQQNLEENVGQGYWRLYYDSRQVTSDG